MHRMEADVINRPMLGLKRDEVKLVPHDPLWKDEFEGVKEQIMQVLPDLHVQQIEHIGSTAILDIQAKPVIDIALGLKEFSEFCRPIEEPLQSIGFYRLNVQRSQEVVFARFADTTFQVKTHFIHMIPFNSEHWLDMLFFRDYMNKHEEARRQYEQLKHNFANQRQQGIAEYTEYKESFIQHIFAVRKQ